MQSYATSRQEGGIRLTQTYVCPTSLCGDELGTAQKQFQPSIK